MATRDARYALDLCLAEVFAAPLAFEEAVHTPVTNLDLMLGGGTLTLWRRVETRLLRQFSTLSVDELTVLRDRVWFRDGTVNGTLRPLSDYAAGLSRILLDSPSLPTQEDGKHSSGDGPQVRRSSGPDGQSRSRERRWRQLWYWLTTALPRDFLAVLCASGPDQPVLWFQDRLHEPLVCPGLGRLLRDAGFAETHLHLGAAFDFSVLWIGLLNFVLKNGFSPQSLFSPGAEFDEGHELSHWLLRAALMRQVLGGLLLTVTPGMTMGEYLARVFELLPFSARVCLGMAVNDLERGTLSNVSPEGFRRLQSTYRILIGRAAPYAIRELGEVPFRDPLCELAGVPSPSWQAGEEHLLAAGLRAQSSAQVEDCLRDQLFWQYYRIRNSIYRHIVLRPMTRGLHWFIRHYERIRPARALFSDFAMLESAAITCGQRCGLRSLEVRTSPGGTRSQLLSFVRAVYDFARRQPVGDDGRRLEVGVVLHIIKDRGDGALQGRGKAFGMGTHAEPAGTRPFQSQRRQNDTPFRYGRFVQNTLQQAETVAWILEHFPLSLRVIRGFDTCTDELGIPNWAIVPAVRRLRHAARTARNRLLERGIDGVPLPRMTIHAGEDFFHLMSGMRQVDEAIDFFELSEGDRLGHALALGVDPIEWTRRTGEISLTAEQRLFDLVWEWSTHARLQTRVSAWRLHALRDEIENLAFHIFGEPVPNTDLERLRRELAQPARLEAVNFPDGCVTQNVGLDDQDQWLHRWLSDPEVFRRSQETVCVPTEHPESYVELQNAVRRKVATLGLVIEVNPSSNLLIGDMADLKGHPLWRLNSPVAEDQIPPVEIVIASDDPITFATSLPEEYQKLADALIEQGQSQDVALKWLDSVRNTGMRSRFTLSTVTDQDFDSVWIL